MFSLVTHLHNHEIWSRLIKVMTEKVSNNKKAAIFKYSNTRTCYLRSTYELQITIYASNTCRKWAKQLLTILLTWLQKNSHAPLLKRWCYMEPSHQKPRGSHLEAHFSVCLCNYTTLLKHYNWPWKTRTTGKLTKLTLTLTLRLK